MTTPERTGTTYGSIAERLIADGTFLEPPSILAGDIRVKVNGKPLLEDCRILAESTYLALVRTSRLTGVRKP